MVKVVAHLHLLIFCCWGRQNADILINPYYVNLDKVIWARVASWYL